MTTEPTASTPPPERRRYRAAKTWGEKGRRAGIGAAVGIALVGLRFTVDAATGPGELPGWAIAAFAVVVLVVGLVAEWYFGSQPER